MSASVGSPTIHRRTFGGPFVISVVLARAFGALAGSLVTRALDEGGVTPHAAIGVERGTPVPAGWDAGKLAAMEGHVLAERFRTSAVGWEPASSRPWRAVCSPSGSAPPQSGWDAGKLEAMEGRVLAECFSNE
jgi:hypothetical protein